MAYNLTSRDRPVNSRNVTDVRIPVWISRETKERLKAEAKADGRSLQNYVSRLFEWRIVNRTDG